MTDRRFLRNVLLKGFTLFVLFNLVWALVDSQGIGKLSLYNYLFRGRERLPFGENPSESYNLSLYNLDAMFASHKISAGTKPADEFRVIIIGDSSTWGTLLRPEETLAGLLDSAGLHYSDGRIVRVYNLGYPTLSLMKDLMILDEAMKYQPDLILWPVTLESFPRHTQNDSPIAANNTTRISALSQKYNLNLTPPQRSQSFWQQTIIGQRRSLADLIRLQFYGVMWSATGIDQTYPVDYTPAARDLTNSVDFHGWQPPVLPMDDFALDVLSAGIKRAGDTPVVLINEPILISQGLNSNIRYNFYYPRWAYDQYRQVLADAASSNGWIYIDLWNLVPQEHFTNSAIHLDPQGEKSFAETLIKGLSPILANGSN